MSALKAPSDCVLYVRALNAYVDYPTLRESLKAELMARMRAEAQKDKSGLGGLGMAIGSAMLGPLIDRLVSPDAMRVTYRCFRSSDPQLRMGMVMRRFKTLLDVLT